MQHIKITCISENTTAFLKSRFFASHGQSLLIEIDEKKYLYDVGALFEGFLFNLQSLQLSVDDFSTVILSHNHLDHSGALFQLIDSFTNQQLLLPPDMSSLHDTDLYRVPPLLENKTHAIQRLLSYPYTSLVTGGRQLDDTLYTTGCLDSADPQWPDKEQALVINIPKKGLVILAACSHPTIQVIVDQARKVTGVDKIYGIIGGLHYARLSTDEIMRNITYLQSLHVDFIVPSHCTGTRATQMMQDMLGSLLHCATIGGQFGSGNSVTLWPELDFSLA